MTERSRDLLAHRAQRWAMTHAFPPSAATPEEVAARKGDERIAVVLPALDEAPTIGAICSAVSDLMPTLVDDLLVVDGGSTDDTCAAAAAAGARVVAAEDLLPSVPFAGGKGDAMWRSLAATDAEIIVWLDADLRSFDPRFITRLVEPLLRHPDLMFVKGAYTRPIDGDPDGGGRVTELLVRPLLSMAFPELGGFVQPLAGEYAGRRDVLERVPFMTGYSVEVALLIDLLEEAGLDALAQADLEVRRHRNRPVAELAPMAHAIARTIVDRAAACGRIDVRGDEPAAPMLREGTRVRAVDVTEHERVPIVALDDAEAVGG